MWIEGLFPYSPVAIRFDEETAKLSISLYKNKI